jgi:predicted oxidoreductase (fatty acid repression mutant protein)
MALGAEGFGCNLQHYNPFVDKSVQEHWNISSDWILKAQLVFGKPVGPPREKTTLPLDERVFMHIS